MTDACPDHDSYRAWCAPCQADADGDGDGVDNGGGSGGSGDNGVGVEDGVTVAVNVAVVIERCPKCDERTVGRVVPAHDNTAACVACIVCGTRYDYDDSPDPAGDGDSGEVNP